MLKGKSKFVIGLLIIFTLVALVPIVLADDTTTPAAVVNPVNAVGGGYCGAGQVQLTDEQKQQLVPLWEQIKETQKQIIQKKVEMGVITQEQADVATQRMEAQYQNKVENGCGFGRGDGQQKGQGHGRGFGMKRGGGAGNQNGAAE